MSRPATGTPSKSNLQPYPLRRAITAPVTSKLPHKPTRNEYSHTFEFSPTKYRPRLRKPIPKNPAWSTRNRSNILPSQPERNAGGGRVPPPLRRWPWQERAAHSEIFGTPRNADANNNASNRQNGRLGNGLQPRVHWPWQIRGQSSAEVFQFDRGIGTTSTAPPSRKWPWQERAMTSLIFNQPEEKTPLHRSYNWDQRRTTSLFEAQESKSTTLQTGRNKQWPWQERARESLIFKPLPPKATKGIWYPWDQRQSVFDDMIDPSAKFDGVSRYNTEFVNKNSDLSSIPPAGKSCYAGVIGGVCNIAQQRRLGKKIFTENKENKEGKECFVTSDQEKNKKLTTGVSNSIEEKSPDEKENQDPEPQRKKTFTVLREANKNKVQPSESKLVDEFANMKIKQEKDTMKKIANITVEGPPSKKTVGFSHPMIVDISD